MVEQVVWYMVSAIASALLPGINSGRGKQSKAATQVPRTKAAYSFTNTTVVFVRSKKGRPVGDQMP